MGLFDPISRHLRKTRAAGRFRTYADPKLVKKILENPQAARMPRRETRIEFVLALLADEDLPQLAKSLGEAIDVLRSSGAWVTGASGSLVFATFGLFQVDGETSQKRKDAVLHMQERFGSNVRIVHGSGNALVGDFEHGAESRFSHFGACIHRFGDALQMLMSIRLGEDREWTDNPDGGSHP